MAEPLKVRKASIVTQVPTQNFMLLYADSEIAEKIRQYGTLWESGSCPGRYTLDVDPRYNFGDVVSYINELIDLG